MGARAQAPTTLILDVGNLKADGMTIDALARLALIARRHGCEPRLWHVSRELRELIEFAGLGEVLPTAPATPGSTRPRC